MSRADRARPHRLRLVGSELRLVLTRRRHLVLLGVLALVPVLIGVALRVGGDRGAGSVFGNVTGNGLFLAFAALVVVVPVFLPVAVAVVAGDAVAGEAASGTLRYLLVSPVGRTRLLATKFVAVVAWCVLGAVVVTLAGVVAGLVLFPAGRVTLLSGTTISYPAALLRLLAAAGYVALMMAALGAVGLFVSTLTEVPVAAMAATLAVAVTSGVLDVVPGLRAVGPLLPTDHWLAFADLLRSPVSWDAMGPGAAVALGYVALGGTLAWARFAGADVTS